MRELLGAPIKEKLLPFVKDKVEGLEFYLYSDREDKGAYYYFKGIKKLLTSLNIPYQEGFLDEGYERFNSESHNKFTLISRPIKDERKLLSSLDSQYDLDMVSIDNVAKLYLGDLNYLPATSKSVYLFLKYYKIEVSAKKALVIGRSLTVGQPIFQLLNKLDATVSLANSKTPSSLLDEEIKSSQIIILASGKKNLVKRELLDKDKIIIDCGYSNMSGDLNFVPSEDECQLYTPVPKGIGSLTSFCLVLNALFLKKQISLEDLPL